LDTQLKDQANGDPNSRKTLQKQSELNDLCRQAILGDEDAAEKLRVMKDDL